MKERYSIIDSLFLTLLLITLQKIDFLACFVDLVEMQSYFYHNFTNSRSNMCIVTFYIDMTQKWMGVLFWQRQIALKKVIYAGGIIASLLFVSPPQKDSVSYLELTYFPFSGIFYIHYLMKFVFLPFFMFLLLNDIHTHCQIIPGKEVLVITIKTMLLMNLEWRKERGQDMFF